MKPSARPIDPYAGVQATTREHQLRHGCGAYTYQDGTLPGAIAAAAGARRVVEVGTALGYTASWLATATSTTTVDTIELDAQHVRLAREQISSVGLEHRITVYHGDSDDLLASLPAGEFDVAFFDGFAPTTATIAGLRTRLRVGGVLLAANLTLGKCSWEPTKQKVRNLVSDPRCTLMLLDPTDPLRSLEIRAVATVTHDPDLEFRRRVGARYGFPVTDGSPPHVVVTFTPERIRGSDYRSCHRAAVARLFLDCLVVQRDAAASMAMVSEDFVSHDPNIDGREGLVDFVEWLKAHHQSSYIKVHHEFVSGDLVTIHHTDRHGENAELAVVDILRVVDGRITEYWGVVGADRPVADTPP